jgi:hypothetical protein
MTQRLPTSDSTLFKRARSVTSQAMGFHCSWTRWPWLLAVLFVLLAGAFTSRAAVTFTNFPSVVSNTYNGIITLQINGLTTGVTNVVVQKYLGVDTNRFIDKYSLLIQQFQLTAGQATTFTNGGTVVTVTNFMPGDMSTTPGQITAPLNFQNGDFAQNLVGQYFYKISSPSGQFAAVTNVLTVTNMFFNSAVTGAVTSAVGGAAVSNAIVLLCVEQNGFLNVKAGGVSGPSGNFALSAPSGTYFLAAAQTNFVINLSAQSSFFMSTNSTNSVGIQLIPSTTSVTGKVVDATSAARLPGLTGLLLSTNNYLSLYFSDTNGSFKASAITNGWTSSINPFAAAFNGYLTPTTNFLIGVSNKVVGFTNALTRGTAIFYGVITNNGGAPMPGVYLFATDNAGHQSAAMTDQRGNYVIDALAETNQWQLSIVPTNNPGLTNNYVFSPGYIQTNFASSGQAIQVNFSLASAPYTISGTVQDINGNPLGGLVVYATSTNGYQAFDTVTGPNGAYSLNVSPVFWTVGITSNSLFSLGYTNVPATQSTNLSGGFSAVINFSILVCGQIGILTTNLPNGMIGSYYETNLQAISCESISDWSTTYGITLTSLFDQTNAAAPPGTPVYSTTGLQGYLLSNFAYGMTKNVWYVSNCTASVSAGNQTATFSDISVPVNVSGPIASNTTVTINGKTWKTTQPTSQSGTSYSTTLFRGGPDSYTITGGYYATNNMLMTGSGKPPTNTVGVLVGVFHPLPQGNSINAGSTIPYTGTNGAVVWIKNGTNWGQYLISAYGVENTNLPPGLSLYPDGTLAGTPTSLGTNNGTFNFTVYAEDTASNIAVQALTLLVLSNTNTTTITVPFLGTNNTVLSSNLFQMQINGVIPGQNYTLLMATNLDSTNWVPIYVTNSPGTNSLLMPDSNATNPSRFYRILLGP